MGGLTDFRYAEVVVGYPTTHVLLHRQCECGARQHALLSVSERATYPGDTVWFADVMWVDGESSVH